MNAVDGSEHYERTSDEPPPSLLTIILDTNPHAWALLSDTLPLSKAIANLLVFINAHLAFNYANKVAVVASHTQRAQWLYPSPPEPRKAAPDDAPPQNAGNGSDIEMGDGPSASQPSGKKKLTLHAPKSRDAAAANGTLPTTPPKPSSDDANKYRPFRLVEDAIMTNLRSVMTSTTETDISATTTTMMAGALTLALAYINRQSLDHTDSGNPGTSATSANTGINNDGSDPAHRQTLQSRILVLSVSGDLAYQYIPVMNCIFAAQRKRIPIDICKIAGDTVFLQQASDATRGIYMALEQPQGLLQYLMMGFLPDQTSRRYLVLPTQVNVDFRAACFCHKKVVDVGFVCSICLSIFCSPPEGAVCLTCGTHLQLGEYGGKPAVMPKKKKSRKIRIDGEGRTPTPGGTPGPS
ncbi:RNA polymerase II transcription factor B subunit 4 [Acarospora aff. strigata]|nr:RNA polymerase II transcription factor B subunit 4 [Acarospora aff. strigata]